LVTGAAQGIGLGIAGRLAEEGMRVALVDIDAPGVMAAADAIRGATGSATLALAGSVAAEDDVARMIAQCGDVFGALDVLVNNAGVDESGAASDVTRASWQRVHDVDLWGAMLMVRASIPLLARDGGSVINISSTHAVATVPNRSTYAAAKAGMVGLSRALAVELGPAGIRVNTILPGYIRTPIWRLWLDDVPEPDRFLETIAKRHPVRRLGTPADVAGLVAFLSSTEASFITGASFVVDGGNTALLEYPPE
jgi:NAD(P)-dependent dehydrogenase (short-subunit alcohol dehydrogenase family)